MKKVLIEVMSDWSDCEQCGGGSEDGGRVTIDGEIVFEHIPHASCFGNESVSTEQLLIEALKSFGCDVDVKYCQIADYEEYEDYEK